MLPTAPTSRQPTKPTQLTGRKGGASETVRWANAQFPALRPHGSQQWRQWWLGPGKEKCPTH
jgi:hypothetical protein